jgi:hypothetical protein
MKSEVEDQRRQSTEVGTNSIDFFALQPQLLELRMRNLPGIATFENPNIYIAINFNKFSFLKKQNPKQSN